MKNRIIKEANYMLDHKATVRKTAEHFGISKSVVHLDMRKRLPNINESLAIEVSHLLETNLAERSTRGGQALANKYANIRRIKNEI